MKKIIAFGASNSRQSINKQLATWSATQTSLPYQVLDLNDFDMPVYSIDRENEQGIPAQAREFKRLISESDGIIIGLAEHNGNLTAAFKNITDWVSRIERGTWANKPVLLLSTSPGPRGGISALKIATTSFPHQGAQVSGSFALPSFHKNFNETNGVAEPRLAHELSQRIADFKVKVTEIATQVAAIN